MNEQNQDNSYKKEEADPSDPCTALVPDAETSAALSENTVLQNPSTPCVSSTVGSDPSHRGIRFRFFRRPRRHDTKSIEGQNLKHMGILRRHGTKSIEGQNLKTFGHMDIPRRHGTKSPGQTRKLLRRILLFTSATLLALIAASGVFACYLIFTAPEIDALAVSPSESATCIYDQEGNILRKLTLPSSNREIITLQDIPAHLQNAIIAIEDARFYEHNGIDLRGIARAFLNGIQSGSFSEGASTITQQLVKNSVFTEWTKESSFFDRLSRKIQEQYLAVQLEKQLSKEEILEDYLNIINLGCGCYGVQAAARRYFGKPASDLTLSESTVLAAIPQNPSALNPISSPENNSRRRTTVLDYMKKQGYITKEAYDEALADNVYDRIREHNAGYDDESAYTYYEDALIDQVIRVLTEEKGYTQDQAYRAVYSGGLQITSAQDSRIQDICDQEFANEENFPDGTLYGVDYALSVSDENGIVTHYGQNDLRAYVRENLDASFDLMCRDPDTAQKYADTFREAVTSHSDTNSPDNAPGETPGQTPVTSHSDTSPANGNSDSSTGAIQVLAERLTLSPQPQASAVILDQATGFVQAIVGGRGEKTASLTLNRATETTRQPGSTFKILTAYAPALDACKKTLATEYDNKPFNYEDGTPVSNWDLNDYTGPTSIREAIIRSVNVVAVQCITEITPLLGFQYARKFGITTLHEHYKSDSGYSSDIVQPLALGGITQGVTNLELCSAYAAIADGGVYHEPKFFTRICDRHGNVIVDYTVPEKDPGTEVIKPSTAWLLTDAMQDVVADEKGTAYGMISAGKMPVAGKTGTTSNYKDIWFVGYTPYYTCCIWGGYDNNAGLPESSTNHIYNKVLWTSIMTRVHDTLPEAEFERPGDVVAVKLCAQSNLPAVTKGCTETYKEFFAKGTQPTGKCPLHKPAPETETEQIYQDLLDKLLPESEFPKQTEAENTGAKNSGSKNMETDNAGTKSTESNNAKNENTEPDNLQPNNPGSDSIQLNNLRAGNLQPNNTESNNSKTENNGDDNLEDDNTQPDNSEDANIQPDDSAVSDNAPEQSQDNFSDQSQDTIQDQTGNNPPANQPQTTSLDDMIEQLNRYGLP